MGSTTIKVCSKCGAHLVRRENVMTTSYPAQYIYDCPECGNVEYDIKCYNGNLTAEDSMNYEKEYNEALERAREILKHTTIEAAIAIKKILPSLDVSEDERIRKNCIHFLELPKGHHADTSEIDNCIAWLEKHKEPEYEPYKKEREIWVENTITDTFPKQDGDFISEEDYRNILRRTANHFYVMGEKQKEQKHDDIIGYATFSDGSTMPIKNRTKEQKPVEPSDEELQRHQDELYDFKVFAAKQAKEHHISFVHDFEWNNFCAELLSYFNEMQKPAEWSEEDERIRQKLIRFISSHNVAALMLADDEQMFISWLKALRAMPKVAVVDGTLWKPSEEQLKALKYVAYHLMPDENYRDEMFLLYEQLKKLMEDK